MSASAPPPLRVSSSSWRSRLTQLSIMPPLQPITPVHAPPPLPAQPPLSLENLSLLKVPLPIASPPSPNSPITLASPSFSSSSVSYSALPVSPLYSALSPQLSALNIESFKPQMRVRSFTEKLSRTSLIAFAVVTSAIIIIIAIAVAVSVTKKSSSSSSETAYVFDSSNNVTLAAVGSWYYTSSTAVLSPLPVPYTETRDTTINYCIFYTNPGCVTFPAGMNGDVHAYWNAQFIAPTNGTFAFSINVFDGADLYIDDQVIFNKFNTGQSPYMDCRQGDTLGYYAALFLMPGVHTITLQYRAAGGSGAVMQLCWLVPGTAAFDLMPIYSYATVQSGFEEADANGALLLDNLSAQSAQFAVGMRRLRQDYDGPWIRLRRAADSVMLDIGFTSSGEPDVNTAKAFAGSSAVTVAVLFDQSASLNHLSQTNTELQPQLNLAVYPPAIVFNSMHSNMYQTLTFSEGYVPQTSHIAAVMQLNSGSLLTNADGLIALMTPKEPYYLYDIKQASYLFFTSDVYINATRYNHAWNSLAPYPNTGITLVHVTLNNAALYDYDNIGYDSALNQHTNGTFYELIIYSTMLTTNDRVLLEQSQSLFYQNLIISHELSNITIFSPIIPSNICVLTNNSYSCSLVGCSTANNPIGFAPAYYDEYYNTNTTTFIQQNLFSDYGTYPWSMSACYFSGVTYADYVWYDGSGTPYYPANQCSPNPVGAMCSRDPVGVSGNIVPQAFSLSLMNPSLYFHFQMDPGLYYIHFIFVDTIFTAGSRISTITINGMVVFANSSTAFDGIHHNTAGYEANFAVHMETTDGNFFIAILGDGQMNTISFQLYNALEWFVPHIYVQNSMYNGGYIDTDLLIPTMSTGVTQAIQHVNLFEPKCITTCYDVAQQLLLYNPFNVTIYIYNSNNNTNNINNNYYVYNILNTTYFTQPNSLYCFNSGEYYFDENIPLATINQYWIGCPNTIFYPISSNIVLSWKSSGNNQTYDGLIFDLSYGYFTMSITPSLPTYFFIFKNCTVRNGQSRNYQYFNIQAVHNILIYNNLFFRLQSDDNYGGNGIVLQIWQAYHVSIHNNIFISCDEAINFGQYFGQEDGPYSYAYIYNNSWIHNEVTGYTTFLDLQGNMNYIYIQNNLISSITQGNWLVANTNNNCPSNNTRKIGMWITNNTVIGTGASDISPLGGCIFKNNTFQSTHYAFSIGQISGSAFINNTFYQSTSYFSAEGDLNCNDGTSYCAFTEGINFDTANTYLNYEIIGFINGTYLYNTMTSSQSGTCPNGCSLYGNQPYCCSEYNPLCH